jgi:hypothetical protein
MNQALHDQVSTMYENLIRVDYHFLNLYYCIGEDLPTDTTEFMPTQDRIAYIREGIRKSVENLENVMESQIDHYDIQSHLRILHDLLEEMFNEFRRVILSDGEQKAKLYSDKVQEILAQVTSL